MKQTHGLSVVMAAGEAAQGTKGSTIGEKMNPPDPIFGAFLERQAEEGRALAQASDILDLDCLPTGQHFLAHYACRGLVKGPDNVEREAEGFHVCVFFGAAYLRTVNPIEVLTFLGPLNTFHPNLAFGAPFICVGRITPGMPLVDLLYQVYPDMHMRAFPQGSTSIEQNGQKRHLRGEGEYNRRPSFLPSHRKRLERRDNQGRNTCF